MPYIPSLRPNPTPKWHWIFFALLILLLLFLSIIKDVARGEEVILTASWYSTESLKKEGTWKTSKGVMSNGQKFDDNRFTCATHLYPLGSRLLVTNLQNAKTVKVVVTDRIGKRFAKTRIDLSQRAFSEIADLKSGLVPVKVEEIG